MTFGHWGKALRVNLTTGQLTTEELDEVFLRRYVGGWGFIAYYLLKEVPTGADPLGPENKLHLYHRANHRPGHRRRRPTHGRGQVATHGWLWRLRERRVLWR